METEIINSSKVCRKRTASIRDKKAIVQHALNFPKQALRTLLLGNLYYFIQYFWSEYSDEKFESNWHLEKICKELEYIAKRVANNQTRKYDLIINVPPGTTKTAMVSIMFPLWCWTRWYWMKFITASYTAPLSLESAEYSRDIIRSDKFKFMFPELGVKSDKDNKSNYRVVKFVYYTPGQVPRIKQGGNRFSTSVGGTFTGFHGHINIVDDPIDPTRAISDAEIKKANHWMDNTLPFRKVNKRVTVTILIMQRLSENDPTGHWLKTKKKKKGKKRKIKHICLPGEIRNYKDQVRPKKFIKYYKDDLLDTRRLSWDILDDIADLGQFTYGGQIGQNPVPLGGGMFKTDMFTIIEKLPHALEVEKTIRYWDKAGTQGGGAYTVGVKKCKLKNGKYIVMNVKRGQWSSNIREDIIKATAQSDDMVEASQYRPKIYIEQEPGSGGLESAESTILNLSGYSIEKDRPSGDKALRADPYSVQVNNGNVMLLRGEWNVDYIEELKYFPGSTFKDQADASSGAFNKLVGLKRVQIGRYRDRKEVA